MQFLAEFYLSGLGTTNERMKIEYPKNEIERPVATVMGFSKVLLDISEAAKLDSFKRYLFIFRSQYPTKWRYNKEFKRNEITEMCCVNELADIIQ